MTTNKDRFITVLTDQYTQLFATPDYAMVAARHTPAGLADKMTNGLLDGAAHKDGEGIKRACKALGIKQTYKAIQEFCNA